MTQFIILPKLISRDTTESKIRIFKQNIFVFSQGSRVETKNK